MYVWVYPRPKVSTHTLVSKLLNDPLAPATPRQAARWQVSESDLTSKWHRFPDTDEDAATEAWPTDVAMVGRGEERLLRASWRGRWRGKVVTGFYSRNTCSRPACSRVPRIAGRVAEGEAQIHGFVGVLAASWDTFLIVSMFPSSFSLCGCFSYRLIVCQVKIFFFFNIRSFQALSKEQKNEIMVNTCGKS